MSAQEAIAALRDRLSGCPFRERRSVEAWLRRVEARIGSGLPIDRSLAQIKKAIEEGEALRSARATVAGRTLSYPEELPLSARRTEIATAIRENQVVVVSGETGSGKTTQLPKICLELGRGVDGLIGHTQPRRVAARSVAERIAEEVGSELGGMVGWQVRFERAKSQRTCIKVMTDGILLAETQHDRFLDAYDTIIVDEAHERSLNIDFLLGYLRRLLPKRPDLKLIVTSATIDADRFSAHFGHCPVLEISGRVHPVEVRHCERESLSSEGGEPSLHESIESALCGLLSEGMRGDVLVFLSGEREIHEALEHLRNVMGEHMELLPLYARLSGKEQRRVFATSSRQRVILATNVAETSITVPGIAAVIDSGFARISRYSARARVQRLPIEQISQASATQRAGRCGRIGPGTCVRLYSKETFDASEPFTQPEILRSNLAGVILRMLAHDLGDIDQFPFLERPPGRMVEEGWSTLHELGAVDRSHKLTETGRVLAKLPVDPRIGRMLVASIEERMLGEVVVLGALLSIQDPRQRPRGCEEAASLAQAAWKDDKSDFVGFLRLWLDFRLHRRENGSAATRRWCGKRYLSWIRMLEWVDVHAQLRELVEDVLGVRGGEADVSRIREGGWGALHRSILSGLVSNIGHRGDNREYVMASGVSFVVHPSSGLHRRDAPWVVAAELVETTRRYGRMVAKIRGDWVERVAPHLVRREYEDPHFLEDSGQVAAFERVYYGNLVVVPKRRVPFGPVDPEGARDVFIQEGLVEERLRSHAEFLLHNAELRKKIELQEEKERRCDLLASSEARFAFYDARLPSQVHNAPSLERWRKSAERSDPTVLRMQESDLLQTRDHRADATSFPDVLEVSGAQWSLAYHHEPGEDSDGVSLEIELAGLRQLEKTRLEWLVPGLLTEKVHALLRSLPKRLRTRFTPARETAEGAAEALVFGEGDLFDALAAYLSKIGPEGVSAADFAPEKLPEHLRMLLVVRDAGGTEIGRGRHLEALIEALGEQARSAFRERVALDGEEWESRGLLHFPNASVPGLLHLKGAHGDVCAWPALVDEGRSVGVTLFDRKVDAERAHRRGVLRAFTLRSGEPMSGLIDWLLTERGLELAYAPLGTSEQLRTEIDGLVAEASFLAAGVDPWVIRDAETFEELFRDGCAQLGVRAEEVVGALEGLLRVRNELLTRFEGAAPQGWADALEDMVREVKRLAPAQLAEVGWQAIREAPRRLEALSRRHDRLAEKGPRRDRLDRDELEPWLLRLEAARSCCARSTALRSFEFALDELRVRLAAPGLALPEAASQRVLRASWNAVCACTPARLEQIK